jgi:hypothetical protein
MSTEARHKLHQKIVSSVPHVEAQPRMLSLLFVLLFGYMYLDLFWNVKLHILEWLIHDPLWSVASGDQYQGRPD